MSARTPVFPYVATLGFGALTGEVAAFPYSILAGLLFASVTTATAFFALVFYDSYARWLLGPEPVRVPLGVMHPRKSRARLEQYPHEIPDAYRGDSGSIPVGAR
jgi:hypothetical protein